MTSKKKPLKGDIAAYTAMTEVMGFLRSKLTYDEFMDVVTRWQKFVNTFVPEEVLTAEQPKKKAGKKAKGSK